MNIFETIANRKVVKEFDKKPVDDKLVGVILYTANMASSAGDIQPWEFIVVKDDAQKKKLSAATFHQKSIATAPLNIVVCANLEKSSLRFEKRGELLYSIQDTSHAATIIMLVATALGLGSDLIRYFDEEEVKSILILPPHLRPVAIIPIGYPVEFVEPPSAIPFENKTWIDRFGKKYELLLATRPEKSDENLLKPLGSYLEDAFRKLKKGEKPRVEKLSFAQILKRLAK